MISRGILVLRRHIYTFTWPLQGNLIVFFTLTADATVSDVSAEGETPCADN